MSTLYVVATPIGNLEDMTPRARRILGEVDLILAEDTRVTRKLLTAFQIKTPLESHHQHNEGVKAAAIIARMQTQDLQVALVSDAGTPAISDPGARLVAAAHEAGIPVVAVPGPSAMAAALSSSGFEEAAFAFYGFLPRKPTELKASLKALQEGPPLAVVYESPHRVKALLTALAEVFPGIRMSLSRELTKVHEQTLRGSVETVLDAFRQDEGLLRGEFVLVLSLPRAQKAQEAEPLSLEARLMDQVVKGFSLREAQEALVAAGHRKNAVYAAALSLKTAAAERLADSQN